MQRVPLPGFSSHLGLGNKGEMLRDSALFAVLQVEAYCLEAGDKLSGA